MAAGAFAVLMIFFTNAAMAAGQEAPPVEGAIS